MWRRQLPGRTLPGFTLLLLALVPSVIACGRQPHAAGLTILITGQELAYIKNCSCSSGQTGGMLREMQLVDDERQQIAASPAAGQPPQELLVLSVGDFSDSSTPSKRIASEMAVKALQQASCTAVGLGKQELLWPQPDLLSLLASSRLPLTCCNLHFVPPRPSLAADKSAALNALLRPYRIATLPSGRRVGVVHAIVSEAVGDLGRFYGFQLSHAAEAVGEVLAAHGHEADYWILTVAEADDARAPVAQGLEQLALLRLIIGFDEANPLAASQGQTIRPQYLPTLDSGAKGLLRIYQALDADGSLGQLEFQQLPLPADLPYEPALAAQWAGMQPRLEALARAEAEEQIQARATARPPAYAGQQACVECHAPIVAKLAASKHLQAYATLKERGVQGNADCVGCHVVGYGSPWGWNAREDQASLRGVQCESCHGPASYHIGLYKKQRPPDLQADGRDKLGLRPATVATCVACHTPDNDAHFQFATYWPKIAH